MNCFMDSYMDAQEIVGQSNRRDLDDTACWKTWWDRRNKAEKRLELVVKGIKNR